MFLNYHFVYELLIFQHVYFQHYYRRSFAKDKRYQHQSTNCRKINCYSLLNFNYILTLDWNIRGHLWTKTKPFIPVHFLNVSRIYSIALLLSIGLHGFHRNFPYNIQHCSLGNYLLPSQLQLFGNGSRNYDCTLKLGNHIGPPGNHKY